MRPNAEFQQPNELAKDLNPLSLSTKGTSGLFGKGAAPQAVKE